MAGARIYAANAVKYASGSIDAFGQTDSLLTAFREEAYATPASGDKMYPVSINISQELNFAVDAGTYAGNYYINRNDPQGEIAWSSSFYGPPYEVNFNLFKNYWHWPPDNRWLPQISNTSADDCTVVVNFDSTKVFEYTSTAGEGLYDPFSGVPNTCENSPGGFTLFDVGSVNTDWTISYTITNITQNANSSVFLYIYDYHFGSTEHNDYSGLNSGNSYTFTNSFSPWKYWKVSKMYISIENE